MRLWHTALVLVFIAGLLAGCQTSATRKYPSYTLEEIGCRVCS